MKITRRQLRRIIKEEKAKLLRESFADAVSQGRAQSRAREEAEFGPTRDGSEQYLEALANLTYAADKALESLDLASRDIGPLDKALYDKLDDAMTVMEDLMELAGEAYDKASEES